MKHTLLLKKINQRLRFFLLLIVTIFFTFNLKAQTILINPTLDGGFENGTTFTANGWIVTNTNQNRWVCSTNATTGFSGNRCAYISDDTAFTHNYTNFLTSVSHLYKNISFPSGETNINLSFTWLANGENNFDKITVWLVPSTYNPASGVAITATGAAPTGRVKLGGNLNSQTTWKLNNINIPASYAGTTVRLVFEWSNDNSFGNQKPGALDNISLTTSVPVCAYSTSNNSYWISSFNTTGGISNINNATTYSNSGYGDYYDSHTVSQFPGSAINFIVNTSSSNHGINIWVDWNKDFDFNDVGENVYSSVSLVSSAFNNFTVPNGQTIGDYRLRIVANKDSGNPNACGNSTYTEAEDYKLSVISPLPCAANPSGVSFTINSATSTTVNWIAANPSPSMGYQYFVSTNSNTPLATETPTGFVGAGITTVTLNNLDNATTYYVWIRSNCGANKGYWIGSIVIFQMDCNIGNGNGTTELGCPTVVAGGLGLNGQDPAPISGCSGNSCADLEAKYLKLGKTNNYIVESIPYAPPYQFSCLKNPVSVNVDDRWSEIQQLPFDFCFYGNTYRSFVIGSNGILSFDISNANSGSGYSFNNNLPSTTGSLFKNSIYGVYHDIDPRKGGKIGYELITLNTGCRALVASWSDVPMFSNNSILYTGMMVLYENTNVIEVYIKEKKIDNNNVSPWNNGNAIVGLQNADATAAVVAPGRNGTDTNWTATNEAWRFVPSGDSITSLKWYEGSAVNGNLIATTDRINVCPNVTTTYTAEVTYTLCNGTTLVKTDETTVQVLGNKVWNGSIDIDWNVPENWTPIGIPTANDCVVIPDVTNDPVIAGTIPNGLGYTLNVLNGGYLTVGRGKGLTIGNKITVNNGGLLEIANTANLVQIDNVTNSGNIKMERFSFLRQLDYCFWSSPVGNGSLGTFPVTSVSPLSPSSLIFKWETTLINPNGGEGYWVRTSENMIPGKGYIIRAPNTFSQNNISTLRANFEGTPTNGSITIPIYRGNDYTTIGTQGMPRTSTDDNWNLIGNPYPSSISANDFLGLPANSNIDGYIKIWTHGLLPSTSTSPFYENFSYNYYLSDYITVNLTGATNGFSDYKIGAGQAFFVAMRPGPAGSSTITFNNSMRNANHDNTMFYRTNEVDKSRIWLDLIASNGPSNRILVGYINGATNEEDRLFDAYSDNKEPQSFYSLINERPMIIQGKEFPFQADDKIPLGIKINTEGNYQIAIALVDGVFVNGSETVYLEDKMLHLVHNLSEAPYSFYAESGTINERFVLKYNQNMLSIPEFENQISVQIDNGISIVSNYFEIKKVEVYDVLGKTLLYKTNLNKKSLLLENIKPNNTVLIVKTTLENDKVVLKKVIY